MSLINLMGGVRGTEWELPDYYYSGKSKSVSTQGANPQGLAFSIDGTKMYTVDTGSDTVYQYALSTAWDVSTAVYSTGKYKSVSGQDITPLGIAFSSDGTRMYISGGTNDTVYQYTLSTAWDVSTALYLSVRKSVLLQTSNLNDIAFSADGTKLYVTSVYSPSSVFQYSLSTAWDISTATYTETVSVSAQETSLRGVCFSDDGTKMYIVGGNADTVFRYDLATAWSISTGTYSGQSFSVGSEVGEYPEAVRFSADGSQFYVIDITTATVFQYNLIGA